MSETSKRTVLVYRTGHLGDTICAVPAFRLIRARFPEARLILLCDRPAGGKVFAEQVVEAFGIFDVVETYRSGRGMMTLWQMTGCVRKHHPELAVILPQARESARNLERKKRFFRGCGVADVRGVNFPTLPNEWQPNEPARLLQVLRAVGIRGGMPAYALPVNAAARQSVREKLARLGIPPNTPFLAFCGGGKEATQQWDLARYGRVLRRVADEFQIPVLGLGNETDAARYRTEVLPLFPDLRQPGPLPLPELFEAFRDAVMYLGNDTGPMHAAAAVGCPVAAVLSARNAPGVWDPDVEPRLIFRHRTECEDCFLRKCGREKHRCMTAITEDLVLAGLLPFLGKALTHKKRQDR